MSELAARVDLSWTDKLRDASLDFATAANNAGSGEFDNGWKINIEPARFSVKPEDADTQQKLNASVYTLSKANKTLVMTVMKRGDGKGNTTLDVMEVMYSDKSEKNRLVAVFYETDKLDGVDRKLIYPEIRSVSPASEKLTKGEELENIASSARSLDAFLRDINLTKDKLARVPLAEKVKGKVSVLAAAGIITSSIITGCGPATDLRDSNAAATVQEYRVEGKNPTPESVDQSQLMNFIKAYTVKIDATQMSGVYVSAAAYEIQHDENRYPKEKWYLFVTAGHMSADQYGDLIISKDGGRGYRIENGSYTFVHDEGGNDLGIVFARIPVDGYDDINPPFAAAKYNDAYFADPGNSKSLGPMVVGGYPSAVVERGGKGNVQLYPLDSTGSLATTKTGENLSSGISGGMIAQLYETTNGRRIFHRGVNSSGFGLQVMASTQNVPKLLKIAAEKMGITD